MAATKMMKQMDMSELNTAILDMAKLAADTSASDYVRDAARRVYRVFLAEKMSRYGG